MRSRSIVASGAVLVVVLGLIPVGRWEARKHANSENTGIRTVVAAIGPLEQPSLDAYRKGVGPGLDCLLYRRGRNPYALEICVDGSGRVVEGYDRRGSSPRIWSLREDSSRATTHVDRAEVERLIARLQAT